MPLAGRAPKRTALVLDGASGQALEVVRSLGRAGWRVLAPAGTRSAASRFAARAVLVPEAEDPRALRDAVRAVLASEDVHLLAPCSDASAQTLWAEHEELGCTPILGGDRASFELASDKAAGLAAAERAGFPVPRWCAAASRADALRFASGLALPFVVKPRRSFVLRSGSLVQRRHRFVRRLAELPAVIEALGGEGAGAPVVQEYVPGRSLAVTAVVHEGRVLAAAARETFSFVPVAGGTSVWKRTIPSSDAGVAEACRLLVDVGFEGLAEVEYQVGEDGVPRLMEIGARAHGWLGLAVAAGADIPTIAASVLLGDDPPPRNGYRAGVEMRWLRGEVLRLATALDPTAELPPGVTRTGVIARSWPPWRPGMRYDGIDRTDLAPVLPASLRPAVVRRRPPDRGLRPAPRFAYPVKAGVTTARSLAWRARTTDGAEAAELRLLFYHRVADDRDELAVRRDRFRRQMQLLAERGHRVVDVATAVGQLDTGMLAARTIGLSFDDGFRDVAEAALPVLQEHGFRATVFVATGVVDGTASFDWYRQSPPVLGWGEIVELDRAGTLRFEAHSVTHPNLLALNDEEAHFEIAESKRVLEHRLGRPVEAFCYPAGLFGDRERRLVRGAGYRLAVSCEPGPVTADADRFALPRQQVDARDRLLDFRAKLGGGHDSPPAVRAVYRRLRYGADDPRRIAPSASS
jgi:peptidoglycan/xylan/chitin deacetylase (PgdA/CDA1 family)/predicted ATP-grasp superfamily ATP-dependent carboligase